MKTLLLVALCVAAVAAYSENEVRSLAFRLLKEIEAKKRADGGAPKPPPTVPKCVKTTIFDAVNPEKCIPVEQMEFLEDHATPIEKLDDIPLANIGKSVEEFEAAILKMAEGINDDFAKAAADVTGQDGIAMLRVVYEKYIAPVEQKLNETMFKGYFGLMRGVIAGTKISSLSKEQNEPGCLDPKKPAPKQVACAMVKAGLVEEAIGESISKTYERHANKYEYKSCDSLYDLYYQHAGTQQFSDVKNAVATAISCMRVNMVQYISLFKNADGKFMTFGGKPMPQLLAMTDILMDINNEVTSLKYGGQFLLSLLSGAGGSGDGDTGAGTWVGGNGSLSPEARASKRTLKNKQQNVRMLLREIAQKINLEY